MALYRIARQRRNTLLKLRPFILSTALLAACAAPETQAPYSQPRTGDELAAQRSIGIIAWMLEGTFETIVQTPGYAAGGGDNTPVRLRVARLWPEREDQPWFYLEYSDPKDDRITRQRLTRFAREGEKIYATDYAFPGDPKSFVGEWRKPRPFASVDPRTLKAIPGCRTLWLIQHDAIVSAGTATDDCRGDGPPGTHEHVDWWLSSSFLRHWIQQLDSTGKQVGGLSGPSEFRRIAQKPR